MPACVCPPSPSPRGVRWRPEQLHGRLESGAPRDADETNGPIVPLLACVIRQKRRHCPSLACTILWHYEGAPSMESLAILHVRPAALPPHAGLRLSLPCRRDPPHGAEAFPGNPPHPPLSKVCRSADHGEASLHCQGGCHSSITMMCSCKAASSMMPVLKSGSPLYFCSSYVCFLRDSENFSALKELNIQWPPTPTRGQPQAASDRNSHAYISYMTEPPQASGSVPCNQIFVGSFKYSDGLYWSLDYWSLVVHLNPPCVDCWNLQNSVIHVSPC